MRKIKSGRQDRLGYHGPTAVHTAGHRVDLLVPGLQPDGPASAWPIK